MTATWSKNTIIEECKTEQYKKEGSEFIEIVRELQNKLEKIYELIIHINDFLLYNIKVAMSTTEILRKELEQGLNDINKISDYNKHILLYIGYAYDEIGRLNINNFIKYHEDDAIEKIVRSVKASYLLRDTAEWFDSISNRLLG